MATILAQTVPILYVFIICLDERGSSGRKTWYGRMHLTKEMVILNLELQ